jgi:hypothetical protein
MGFISKKVNFIVFLQKPQTICLVPSLWHYIKWNLSSDWISHVKVYKLFFKSVDKFFTYFMLLIISFELISLLLRTVSSNRWNVNHSGTVFNKSSALYRNFNLWQVFKTKINESFQLFFWQMLIYWLHYWIGTCVPIN